MHVNVSICSLQTRVIQMYFGYSSLMGHVFILQLFAKMYKLWYLFRYCNQIWVRVKEAQMTEKKHGNQKTFTHTWPRLIEINRMCPAILLALLSALLSMIIIRGTDKFTAWFLFFDNSGADSNKVKLCILDNIQTLVQCSSCFDYNSYYIASTKSNARVLPLLVYFRIESDWFTHCGFFVSRQSFRFPSFSSSGPVAVTLMDVSTLFINTNSMANDYFVILIHHRGPLVFVIQSPQK